MRRIFWYEENLVSGGFGNGELGMSWISYEDFGMRRIWNKKNLN